ncbi:VOC family protein [Paenibacillus polygoni]|uniref:VOC family protein n=1 Tax=Paenibacillus polygoni TaxID=3050112 RepID=A0ABY8XAX9_9BACL|nr:VOC family protein [Paenibacillus polygoni]WIV21278.1 VOC family protein [Paenibacillus polygoni]
MISELTIQIRVSDFEEGLHWYTTLLQRTPDFIPHNGFAEWQVLPSCWLQVAEGIPSEGSGPIRFGVTSIEEERSRLKSELHMDHFEIYAREEVPAKWATFADPWGNRLGFFENINE